jgi:hypothetical protein
MMGENSETKRIRFTKFPTPLVKISEIGWSAALAGSAAGLPRWLVGKDL